MEYGTVCFVVMPFGAKQVGSRSILGGPLRRARMVDFEHIGALRHDLIGGAPLLTYLRYNLQLPSELSAMDEPDNLDALKALGEGAAEQPVRGDDFAHHFDLTA